MPTHYSPSSFQFTPLLLNKVPTKSSLVEVAQDPVDLEISQGELLIHIAITAVYTLYYTMH